MKLTKQFSQSVRVMRALTGLTQEELGDKVGLSRVAIKKIESGNGKYIRTKNYEHIQSWIDTENVNRIINGGY